jgi:MFS family permease
MNKPIRWIQNYLLYALPFVLICMAWGTIHPEKQILTDATFLTKATWEILSWNLMFWFAVLILFLFLLVVLPEAREKTLKRLANVKERDEREQFITGKASRAAYISTLSLMILLLFFSIFSLNIYRAPEKEAINGKTGTVAIGLGFSLIDKPRIETNSENKVIFESKDIPLSKTAILLALIIWQLASFNFTARRENVRELHE